jgi:hypothetical protein
LVCRQRHDIYAVVSEKKLLLTGTGAEVGSYPENGVGQRWIVSAKHSNLSKKRRWKGLAGSSYFYRKMNGLSSADSDDDPSLVGDDVHAHDLERNQRRKRTSALWRKRAIEVDTNEV